MSKGNFQIISRETWRLGLALQILRSSESVELNFQFGRSLANFPTSCRFRATGCLLPISVGRLHSTSESSWLLPVTTFQLLKLTALPIDRFEYFGLSTFPMFCRHGAGTDSKLTHCSLHHQLPVLNPFVNVTRSPMVYLFLSDVTKVRPH